MLDTILILAAWIIVAAIYMVTSFRMLETGKSAPALTEQAPPENTSEQVYPIHYF
jgi:hypothetical protein